MSRKHMTTEGLAGELARLSNLERDALKEYWQQLYGCVIPINASRAFLNYAIAHRLQEKALGEMKPGIRRMLKQTSEDGAYKRKVSMPGASLKTGKRLLSEWHGVTHEVILTEDGVQFQGKRYRSLSEVARIITGTRWSGPLFFGLKKREAA